MLFDSGNYKTIEGKKIVHIYTTHKLPEFTTHKAGWVPLRLRQIDQWDMAEYALRRGLQLPFKIYCHKQGQVSAWKVTQRIPLTCEPLYRITVHYERTYQSTITIKRFGGIMPGKILHEEELGRVCRLLDDFYDGDLEMDQAGFQHLRGMKRRLTAGEGLTAEQYEYLERLG